MTQILVTLNEDATTLHVRKAIELLRGVVSTTVLKTKDESNKKTLRQQAYVKESLERAFDEMKQARREGRKLQSADDFMKVEIVLGDEFKRQFKRLAKKYPSLKDDFITFKKELADDPFQGSDLGNGTRKVRMAIASKGKGKSGGARVITFNFIQHDDDSIEITLLTIYDKGEISSVTDKYIKWLVSLING